MLSNKQIKMILQMIEQSSFSGAIAEEIVGIKQELRKTLERKVYKD